MKPAYDHVRPVMLSRTALRKAIHDGRILSSPRRVILRSRRKLPGPVTWVLIGLGLFLIWRM